MATAKKTAPKKTAATAKKTAPKKAAAVARAAAPKIGRPKGSKNGTSSVGTDPRSKARAKGNAIPTVTREEKRAADLDLQAKLVTAARAKTGVSSAEFQQMTGAPKSAAARVIRHALEAGSVRKEGSTKRARYFAEKK